MLTSLQSVGNGGGSSCDGAREYASRGAAAAARCGVSGRLVGRVSAASCLRGANAKCTNANANNGGSGLGRTAATGLQSRPQEAKLANCGIISYTLNTLTHAAAGGALGGVAADGSSCLSSVGWLGAPLPEGSRACCDGAASPAASERLAWSNCCSICATAHCQSSLLSGLRDAMPPNACGVFRLAFCIDFSPDRRELPPAVYEEHAEAAGLGDRCMLRAEPQGRLKSHRNPHALGPSQGR